ncbi:MAG: hypothetical protein AB7I19_06470 [Planctomycetota bacterium]
MPALTFDDPARGWLLVLVIVVWWLARPLRVRARILTAQVERWRAALMRLGRPRARPRPLRWILLALALGCAVFAATGPRLGARAGARRLVVALDRSPSMGATESDGTSAYAQALEAIRDLSGEVSTAVSLRVLTVGERLAVVDVGSPEEVERLPQVVDGEFGTTSTDAARRWTAVVDDLLQSAGAAAGDLAVLTLTDARGSAELPARGALRILGSTRPNRGIASATLTDSWPSSAMSLAVTLWAPTDTRLPDLVVAGGARFEEGAAAEASSSARFEEGRWHATYRLRRSVGGTFSVTLPRHDDDALAVDDHVEFAIPPPSLGRIGVLHPADGAPDRDVTLAATWLADQVGGEVVDSGRDPSLAVDAVLVDGGRLIDIPPRAIAFGATLPGEATADAVATRVIGWDRNHPLTRGLDLADLVLDAAVPMRSLPPEAKVLIEGERGPLLVAVESPARRALLFAFRPSASNLPLLSAFPQLLLRSVSFLAGPGPQPPPQTAGIGAGECDLRRQGPVADRALPPLSRPGESLAAIALASAAMLLALRLWV